MQPHFDYACSVWHPNLSNRLLLLSLLLLLLLLLVVVVVVVVVVAVVVVLLIYLLVTAFTKKNKLIKVKITNTPKQMHSPLSEFK